MGYPGTMTVYKVRDPKTGLFQRGGAGHNGRWWWHKTGKTWSTAGHLRQHFTLMRESQTPIDPAWAVNERQMELLVRRWPQLGVVAPEPSAPTPEPHSKVCNRCWKQKSLDDFPRETPTKKRKNICKECRKQFNDLTLRLRNERVG